MKVLRTLNKEESTHFLNQLSAGEPVPAIMAKNPAASRTVDSHIGHGSRKGYKSQYISTTKSEMVAMKYAEENQVIVIIDLEKLSECIIYDVSGENDSLIKGPMIRNFAKASKELLVCGRIPGEAIEPFMMRTKNGWTFLSEYDSLETRQKLFRNLRKWDK